MLNHVWLNYIVIENDEIKKKICCPTCPAVGASWATMWGTMGRTLGGAKKFTKK